MLSHYHIPSYFSKTVREEIGELFAASAIGNLALSIAMVFEPIFLYSILHFTVSQVLLFFAIVYSVYIPTIILGAKFASNYGYKHAIAMSVPFQILYWVLLLLARDNPGLVVVSAIALALQKSLYWPGFHALMARYADQGQVGREFSVVYATIGLSQIVGPFLGGFMAQHFGMTATFVVASLVYCFSVMPLFTKRETFVPKPYLYRDTFKLLHDFPKKFLGYVGFGEELLVLTIWPIFIYIVAKDYEKTGTVATVASFIAAVLALIIGKITDQYTKRVLIKLGAFFSSLVWFARLTASSIWNVFTLDTLSRASKEMDFIPISTVTYLRAEATHVVPYAVFFEQSLSVGKLSACLLGALLFGLTGSFMVLFILGGLYSLLYMFI
ncbi:MAG: MFS transporter [Patescibacteria group bacterium]|nr:MFS transporter [Patescibacteria group bacterium]